MQQHFYTFNISDKVQSVFKYGSYERYKMLYSK